MERQEEAAEEEVDEEKLRNYLNSHPEFLEKWLAEKTNGDLYLRNLLGAFNKRRKGGGGAGSNNGTGGNNNEIYNAEDDSSAEINLDEERSLGGGSGCATPRKESSSNPSNTSSSSNHNNNNNFRSSKRNSISSDRFHNWLSSSNTTNNPGASNNSSNNNNNNNNHGETDSTDPGCDNNNKNNNKRAIEGDQTGGSGRSSGADSDGDSSTSKKKRDDDWKSKITDPNELFIELVKDISNELNIDCLCHKILVNVSYLVNADRSSLFLARGPHDQRYLVAKLFDVTADSGPEEALERARREEIKIPFGVGIVGHVAAAKEIVNICNAYDDPRFNHQVDSRTDYKTHSILALPICNNEGEVIGVAQVINKKTGEDFAFTSEDVEIFQRYLTFCGIGIQNAQLFETSVAEYRKNQLLLNLAQSIFEEQTSLERLVSKIMKEAQGLLKCEQSLVYLRDVPLYEASQIERILTMSTMGHTTGAAFAVDRNKLQTRRESKTVTVTQVLLEKGTPFDFIFELKMGDDQVRRISASQLESSPLTMIAQYVATKSEILNIGDCITWYNQCGAAGERAADSGEIVAAYLSNLPKSILCMPIYNGQRQVIGVAQLINKANNQPFTDSDAITFEAFAIFCGLGIHNTQLYESACKLMAKQSVALECLSYHATASPEDTERLRRDDIPSCAHYKLLNYDFSDFGLTDSDTCKATIRMFLELNLVEKFHIPYAVLCRWILSVKKNYRPVKYHNWRHAFNVAQTMFTVLKIGRMEQFLDDLDILGLMVACLCHDLDHRGTNNAFQQLTASPLAVLYSTSTMEHHHFDQCVMILSSEGNNIFQDLSADDYRKVMKIVEKSILSTDLAMYFRKKDKFIELVENGEISWQGEDKKELLCGMMMTACDVAAIAKPWELQHKIAKLVADEFFDQGDLEKEQLNQQPVAMMDREKKDELPKMQLSFIDVICLPLYKTLADIFPWLQPLYDGCKNNRKNWQDLAEKVDMGLTWIDHDFIEKPVEEFAGTDPELEDVNFVVTTLQCTNVAEAGGTGKEAASSGVGGSKGAKFRVGKWLRSGRKSGSRDSKESNCSSLQSPTTHEKSTVGGSMTMTTTDPMEAAKVLEVEVHEKYSPHKSCSIC